MTIDEITRKLIEQQARKAEPKPEDQLMRYLSEHTIGAEVNVTRREMRLPDRPSDTTTVYYDGRYRHETVTVEVHREIDEYPDETFSGHYCLGSTEISSSLMICDRDKILYQSSSGREAEDVLDALRRIKKRI